MVYSLLWMGSLASWSGILSGLLTVVFLLACVLLVMIVLLQPSHGEGLGSAFGGGISESFFGTHAMTWLARATIAIALIFLGLTIAINKMPRQGGGSGSIMQNESAPARSGEASEPTEKPTPPEAPPAKPNSP
jgi:preprotein translocase subunit SecG